MRYIFSNSNKNMIDENLPTELSKLIIRNNGVCMCNKHLQ